MTLCCQNLKLSTLRHTTSWTSHCWRRRRGSKESSRDEKRGRSRPRRRRQSKTTISPKCKNQFCSIIRRTSSTRGLFQKWGTLLVRGRPQATTTPQQSSTPSSPKSFRWLRAASHRWRKLTQRRLQDLGSRSRRKSRRWFLSKDKTNTRIRLEVRNSWPLQRLPQPMPGESRLLRKVSSLLIQLPWQLVWALSRWASNPKRRKRRWAPTRHCRRRHRSVRCNWLPSKLPLNNSSSALASSNAKQRAASNSPTRSTQSKTSKKQ